MCKECHQNKLARNCPEVCYCPECDYEVCYRCTEWGYEYPPEFKRRFNRFQQDEFQEMLNNLSVSDEEKKNEATESQDIEIREYDPIWDNTEVEDLNSKPTIFQVTLSPEEAARLSEYWGTNSNKNTDNTNNNNNNNNNLTQHYRGETNNNNNNLAHQYNTPVPGCSSMLTPISITNSDDAQPMEC